MTDSRKKDLLLVALPTFPKGNAPLALPYLAALLGREYRVRAIDLNLMDTEAALTEARNIRPAMVGISVSAQNHRHAERLSLALKEACPGVPIVWGGEYPTLLPEACAPFAHTIVKGLFDTVADAFMQDLRSGSLHPVYEGGNSALPQQWVTPDWKAIGWPTGYNRFMGLPMETSRGCTEHCTFCMVLIMQRKHYHTRPLDAIAADVKAIGRELINIIDYNFGVSVEHVEAVCGIIAQSEALGFTCEMTLELLDDDRVLAALASARCRAVYCGLESLDEVALHSVGKDRTNTIGHYRRIIAKARRAGVEVASGLIIGMEHSNAQSYRTAFDFFAEVGIFYVKLTYLTFNPGTRSQRHYRSKGTFVTEEPRFYDGNHLTFVPNGVSVEETYAATRWFIGRFYSPLGILRRAWKAGGGWRQQAVFVLFNLLFSQVYDHWLSAGMLRAGHDPDSLPTGPHRRSARQRLAEGLLLRLWR